MALSDYKINAFSKPVSALGDTPQMSAAELKEWFDSNSTNELKNSVNGIIDETVAELSGKVNKVAGKDLSTNDYTNEEKQKVALAVTQDELEGAIADLINGAPEALDTLKELGDALALHEDAYDALLEMVGNKANKTELDAYATKEALENGKISPAYSQTADLAFNADYADFAGYATSATTDAMDNDIIATYATKEELPKWKTLIDTTLTEEQGGVSEILLAIEDVEAFLNARQIRIAMSFPVAEEKAASAFSTTIKICDRNRTAYSQTVLSGANSKGAANSTYFTTVSIDMFDFKYSTNMTRSYHSLMQLPTPYYTKPANAVKAPMVVTSGFDIARLGTHPPHMIIILSGSAPPTFEAKTHIFMEVCE